MKTKILKFRTLQTNLIKLLLLFLTVAFFACEESNVELLPAQDEQAIESEVAVESSFEDVDDMVAVGMALADAPTGDRMETEDDDRFHCAEVTHDKENKIIIIDFGDGCEDPRGRLRAGKIIITYTGRRFVPGSKITTTFENYSVNGIKLEGVRTVENISESLEALPKFHITLVGGKATWEDGTFATREVDRTRTWIREANPLNDEFHVEGTAGGTNRHGNNYLVTIIERLVFARRCFLQRIHLPVSGVKEVVKGDRVFLIDFGDGECDNIITITVDGQTKEIDLSNRDI